MSVTERKRFTQNFRNYLYIINTTAYHISGVEKSKIKHKKFHLNIFMTNFLCLRKTIQYKTYISINILFMSGNFEIEIHDNYIFWFKI